MMMSTVLARSGRDRASGGGLPPGGDGGSSPVLAGLRAAAQAVAASLVVILVPTVLAWATASYSRAPWEQAVRFGVDAWLLAHHTGIVVAGGHVGLTPLGLLLIPLVSCWFAGVRLARFLDPNAAAIAGGVGRSEPSWPPPRALLALVLGYAGLVTLAGVLVTAPGARPLVAQAFAGALMVCAPAAVLGAGTWVAGGRRRGLVVAVRLLRLPVEVRRGLRPAALAVGVHLIGAALVLLVAVVTSWHQITGLHAALDPGPAGGVVLVVAQLSAVPNLVLWAGAFAAGPGFAVGTGTAVTPAATHLGALPAVPLLAALPSPGAQPGWLWLVLALPVLGGAVAGWVIVRRRPEAPVRSLLGDAGVTAALAGLTWLVLAWLASGPAGPGRLAHFGPNPGLVGGAVLLEVGAGAVAVVAASRLTRKLDQIVP